VDVRAETMTSNRIDFSFGFDSPAFSDRVMQFRAVRAGSLTDDDDVFSQLHINTLVVAAQSPVFKAMFTIGMKETSNAVVISVKDEQDAKLHNALVRFMYNAELPKEAKSTELIQLAYLADKFQIAGLIEACTQAICSHMTFDLAHDILQHESLPESCSSLSSTATQVVAAQFRVEPPVGNLISVQDLDTSYTSKEFRELPFRVVCMLLSR
jgi:hypothetical protein